MEYDTTVACLGYFNHVLLTALQDGRRRRELSLKYVGQRWGKGPYWYFWFTDCPGVYKLALAKTRATRGYAWQAFFKVFYYPSLNEPNFLRLSRFERQCRNSPLFAAGASFSGCECSAHRQGTHGQARKCGHSTGVPAEEYADLLPDDFFYAGGISVGLKTTQASWIRMKTYSVWQVRALEDIKLPDVGEAGPFIAAGTVDRNFPGYEITLFLYEKLLSGWASYHKYHRQQRASSSRDGALFFTDGTSLSAQPCSDAKAITLHTAFR